jgi:hypothetical protein
MRKFVYDYYKVAVPSDLSSDPDVMAQQAIRQAEESTRVYAMPCDWSAERIGEDCLDVHYRVRRRRLAQVK